MRGARLCRATVDRWMPRIEEHERRFDRRGAVLAMLGQLKQVCNHPELVLPSGRPLEGRAGKLERLVELLRAVPENDRSLVFTQYPGFGRLAPHLSERLGVEVGFFPGGLNGRSRGRLAGRVADGDRRGAPSPAGLRRGPAPRSSWSRAARAVAG